MAGRRRGLACSACVVLNHPPLRRCSVKLVLPLNTELLRLFAVLALESEPVDPRL